MKYIKVSKKAESFYDSHTGLFMRKGEVAILDAGKMSSSKVVAALKGGHLEYSDKEAYEKWVESQKVAATRTEEGTEQVEEKYAEIPTNSAKAIRKWLKETYELDEADLETVETLKSKEELTQFAKEYIDAVEAGENEEDEGKEE